MKRHDLVRHLEQHGCHLLREGRRHSVFVNPAANATSTVPRPPRSTSSSPARSAATCKSRNLDGLLVQRGGADPDPYIDVGNILNDIGSRQNHAVFARRGCGKTLLLHHSSRILDSSIKSIYLNCEDFKRHSFPNVLIEILDTLFGELEHNLTGWFGKKKQSRTLIREIRKEFDQLRIKADMQEQSVRESVARENSASANVGASVSSAPTSLRIGAGMAEKMKAETERTYRILDDKIRELDTKLPKLKAQIREFFDLSAAVEGVFLQIDDFYHLKIPELRIDPGLAEHPFPPDPPGAGLAAEASSWFVPAGAGRATPRGPALALPTSIRFRT